LNRDGELEISATEIDMRGLFADINDCVESAIPAEETAIKAAKAVASGIQSNH
jgi:hypothetical protein